VTATLALIVALGGTSYAVTALPRNSVGAKQLKTDAVNSSKVRDGSLRAKDFATGQLPSGAMGATGAAGLKGDPGAKGDSGSPGLAPVFTGYTQHGSFPLGFLAPLNTVIVPLSAGSYVIHGNIVFNNPNASVHKMTCALVANGIGTTAQLDTEEVDVGPGGAASISTTGTLQTDAPVGIFLNCGPDPAAPLDTSAITFADADIVAIAVGTID
jgi:hypothetical protein